MGTLRRLEPREAKRRGRPATGRTYDAKRTFELTTGENQAVETIAVRRGVPAAEALRQLIREEASRTAVKSPVGNSASAALLEEAAALEREAVEVLMQGQRTADRLRSHAATLRCLAV